jgi:hypothetical protein
LLAEILLPPEEEDNTADTEELPHRVSNNDTSIVTKKFSIVLERLSPKLVQTLLSRKPFPSRNMAKRTGQRVSFCPYFVF